MNALALLTLLVHPLAFGAATPVVIIDPGHGGTQTGAASDVGVLEKNLALALAKKVKARLEETLHATAVLTRDADTLVHLSDRVAFANARNPDVFVSIHANSMPTPRQRRLVEGVETYFLSANASGEQATKVAARENADAAQKGAKKQGPVAAILADLQRAEAHAQSSALAYAIHEQIVSQTGAQDRGVQQAPFYVLMGLEAPAVLVEVGFISHPEEGHRIADAKYQDALAKAICDGVQRFFESARNRDHVR